MADEPHEVDSYVMRSREIDVVAQAGLPGQRYHFKNIPALGLTRSAAVEDDQSSFWRSAGQL